MIVRTRHIPFALFALVLLAGCGEPMFENAGSQQSLIEDREACAVEIDQSQAAMIYRQNPAAYPDYPTQVFEEMNRCIERKGWKQVRSQYEQEQLRGAIQSEAHRNGVASLTSDPAATKSFVQGVEDRLAHASNAAQKEGKTN